MQKLALCFVLSTAFATASLGQIPTFRADARVGSAVQIDTTAKRLILVYGGVYCDFTLALIQNLYRLNSCKNAQIVVLMTDSPDDIREKIPAYLDIFAVYSNQILKHSFKKDNDIAPQIFVFEDKMQVLRIKGIHKGMIKKIRRQIGCSDE
ncbi:MAG: hypothetical protein EAZ70_07730 [Runella slithyformis]|jgi:hypothetical protein|nr:MAG: hypothetical protein EAY79_07320 [Runella slithyformis]TAF27140.1 MAG: hypothetical protein EAZ70_07730 [Runella slithyformis]TAF45579.1 MAG: hypothetical protein EAZ63_10725 [Runella slithyformis]TAF82659.1 MAG: hypothetical protein EAZ50_03445 [Runella slithyformis]